MGMKTRISNIFKSNINHFITCAEDPHKIINNSVEELDDSLESAKRRVINLKNEIEDNKRYQINISDQVKYWRNKAESFVMGGMEENAKLAIKKRRLLDEIERNLNLQIVEQEVRYKEVVKQLNEINTRVIVAKSKRKLLISRKPINWEFLHDGEYPKLDLSEQKSVENSYKVFSRMEERIQSKNDLDVIKDIRGKEIFEHEEKLINEELENIKAKLKGGKK